MDWLCEAFNVPIEAQTGVQFRLLTNEVYHGIVQGQEHPEEQLEKNTEYEGIYQDQEYPEEQLETDTECEGIYQNQEHSEELSVWTLFKRELNYFNQLDKLKIKWTAVGQLLIPTIIAFYGGFNYFYCVSLYTFVFITFWGVSAGIGITMGAHRYSSHKSFKAAWPVRVVCMLMNSAAFMESLILWPHYHRVHHKWSDTDRDVTNSLRGLLFAHVGWKMHEEHPEVSVGRSLICIEDLTKDPVVVFQHKYYYWLSVPMAFIIPSLVPWLFWEEILERSISVCFFSLFLVHNFTFCVNSVAHMFGYRPHDVTTYTFDNGIVQVMALGEGHHNFHHTHPYDYRASEHSGRIGSLTTIVIEALAKLGLVWDLKVVTEEHIIARKVRTGDLSNAVPVDPMH